MTRKRNRFQMIADTLESANKWINFTQLMYKARTNQVLLKEITNSCVNFGLMEKREKLVYIKSGSGGKLLSVNPCRRKVIKFKTTEKGKLFIRNVREIEKLLELTKND